MRKLVMAFLLLFSLMVGGIVLSSCDLKDSVYSESTDYNFDDITFESEEFSYDGKSHSLSIEGELPKSIKVIYDNNDQTEVGKYKVTATFTKNGTILDTKTAYLTIKRVLYELDGISFPDRSYTYNGTIPEPKVEGNILDSLEIKYNYNNIKANPGVYKATASIIDKDGKYNALTLTANITIEAPSFDVNSIKFSNKEVLYDGNYQSILVEGDLPEYISVNYIGNKQTAVGDYEVTAKFVIDDLYKDYIKAIPDKTAVLSIVQSEEDMTGITFEGASYTYDGEIKSLKAENVPADVKVSYENNYKTEAGTYVVTAHFTSSTRTYPKKKATLTIEKADYDISNVQFKDKIFAYDSKSHSLEIENLPSIFDVSYVGNDRTLIGEYNVTAVIKSTNPNYNDPQSMYAMLTIEKPNFDGSKIELNNKEVVRDGNAHSVTIDSELPDYITVSYTGNGQTEIGDYEITATFTIADDYKEYINPISPKKAMLSIVASASDISGIILDSQTFTYDGNAKSLKAVNVPEGVTVTYEGNNQINAGTYTVTARFTSSSKTFANKIATLTINKADYDMTNVKFKNLTVSYDKEYHSIEVENLPENLSVSYSDNNHNSIGEYNVKAIFTSNNINYNNPLPMTATLKIIPATISIKFIADDCVYDGNEHGISYEGELPEGMTISGIESKHINAGTYEYLISLNSKNLDDLINYVYDVNSDEVKYGDNLYSNVYKMTLNIEKATYDYSKIMLDEGSFKYANGKYSVGMSSVLDNGIIVKYDFGDENVITNDDGTLSGELTVKLSFTVTDSNYNDIPTMFIDIDLAKINATITFDVNGGDALEKNVLSLAELITNAGAPKPKKDGYVFKGWVYDDNGEEVAIDYAAMKSLIGNITLKAKWGEPEDNLTYKLSDDSTYYIVSGYTSGINTEVIIPDEYNGLPIKEIASNVFYYKQDIQGIFVGSNVEKINSGNFYACNNLEYLVLGEKISIIDNSIKNLKSLKTLEFKGTTIKEILGDSFNTLPLIEEIDLSNQPLIKITDETAKYSRSAFCSNEKLKIVKLPATIEYISGYSFRKNASTFDINLPSTCQNYEKVGYEIYSKDHSEFIYYNENLSDTDYTLKYEDVTIIREAACINCKNMVAFRRKNENGTRLTKICSSAFRNCSALVKFVFEDCEIVESSAFSYCSSIILFDELYSSILEFGNSAFSNSNVFPTVKISANVRSMGDDVFAYSNLSVVDLSLVTNQNFKFEKAEELEKVIFNSNLTTIPKNAFAQCKALTTLENFNPTTIKENAFICTKLDLSEINLNNVVTIETAAFFSDYFVSDEELLASGISLNLPLIKTIGAFAFYNQSIRRVTLPVVETIGYGAFNSNVDYWKERLIIDARGTKNINVQLCLDTIVHIYSNNSNAEITNHHNSICQRALEIKINSSQKVFVNDVRITASVLNDEESLFVNSELYSNDIIYGSAYTYEGFTSYYYKLSYHVPTAYSQMTIYNKIIKFIDFSDYVPQDANDKYINNTIKITIS